MADCFRDLVRAKFEDHVANTFPDLWARLTPHGQAQLVDELAQAGDKDQLNRVVMAWYRTLWVRSDPDYEANMSRDLSDEKPMSAAEFLA